ncbi:MAG: pyruvate kinase [Pseudomonadota bacterium]
MHRNRNAKIIATLGPASADESVIEKLFLAGADVFRLNFSHGSHDDHRALVKSIRDVESKVDRPIGILLDLQGPKLRLAEFAEGSVDLQQGQQFRLDLDETPGDVTRAPLPHPEIFAAIEEGTILLLDDGRVRLEVTDCSPSHADTIVRVPGTLSDHKGVNVPGVVLPLPPLTEKDREDLAFGLDLGIDWVGLSFVQRPEDGYLLRSLVDRRASLMCKLEKPAALKQLPGIVEHFDAVMVARGDLGVELPPEQVPGAQKRIVRVCRQAGKPVIVATQMLDSMMRAPVPTRAEASDVATAVYDGADAVMLSGESAVGQFPVQSVEMMDRILREVEQDPHYLEVLAAQHLPPEPTTADAICHALQAVAQTLSVSTTVIYTASGSSALRAARARPRAAILTLTPNVATARRLAVVWGVHAVIIEDVQGTQQMVDKASQTAVHEGFADRGDRIVIAAGMPFGTAGSTNLLRVARIPTKPRTQ